MRSVGVDVNVVVNEEEANNRDECPTYNPRILEQKLKNRRMRVYQVGKRLYARTSKCFNQNNDQNEKSNWSVRRN